MIEIQNPFNGDIRNEAISNWLNQFKENECPTIKRLLSNFRYYSSKKVNILVQVLHKEIVDFSGVSPDKIWFVPVGYIAKSGSVVAYFYKSQNGLDSAHFISTEDFKKLKFEDDSAIVFLDDFIGSGHQASALWRDVIEPVVSTGKKIKVIFAALVGYDLGIEYLNKNTGFKVIAADLLPKSASPFLEDSGVFKNDEDRENARKILKYYGKNLFPDHPFGYASSELLVGFFYSTPTNTLPVFWSYQANWKPLLPRGDSYIDPENLVTIDYNYRDEHILKNQRRSISESRQLEKYNISPDIAVKIFNEFRLSSIFLVLAPVLDELKIKEDILSGLLDVINLLKYRQQDGKNVCSSVMIIPQDIDDKNILDKIILKKAGNILDSLDELVSSTSIINGYEGAFIVKSDGNMQGNMIFGEKIKPLKSPIAERYLKAANVSLQTSGLLFLFKGDGKITMFYKGCRILSRQRATWHIHPADLTKGINYLAKKHTVDKEILKSLVKYVYKISDEEKSAFITYGDHENVLKYSDPKKDYIKCLEISVESCSDDFLLQLFSKRGAAIIDNDGNIIRGMTFLRPPAVKDAGIDISKASKYNIAAKISFLTRAICIVAELDGNITVYSEGKIAFRVMG